LLKGLRNNLITKDLNFTYENKQKKASFKHVIQFYEFDKDQSTEGDRLVPKLSDSHVHQEKKYEGVNCSPSLKSACWSNHEKNVHNDKHL